MLLPIRILVAAGCGFAYNLPRSAVICARNVLIEARHSPQLFLTLGRSWIEQSYATGCDLTVPMSTRFHIRSFQRFSYQCPVYYSNDECHGTGTVWNLSMNGWRVDGSSPIEPGTIVTLCLFLPNETQTVLVDQATVRWSRGQEFGIETNIMRAEHETRLKQLVQSLI